MENIRFRSLALLTVLIAGPASSAHAEFFFDFSIGAAFTQPTEVEVRDERFSPDLVVTEDTNFDPSISLGLRFGNWIDPVPWLGFGFDFSYFRADGGPFDWNDVYPLTPLIMFRLPLLQAPHFPYGQVQPYAAVGPGFFVSEARVDLRPEVSERLSDSTLDVGLDARAGIAILFHPNVGFFAEYRFTYFEQRLEDFDDEFDSFDDIDVTSKTTFITHHVLIGITLRF